MAKSGPNTHTNYILGVPKKPGWYATKSVFGERCTATDRRKIRRFFDGSHWSRPIMVTKSLTAEAIEDAKNTLDKGAVGRLMYSTIKNYKPSGVKS